MELKHGDLVSLDLSVQYRGYQTDYGRSWIVGKPNSEQKRDYENTMLALSATLSECRPGAIASDIVKKCHSEMERVDSGIEEVISESGFLGHGIGLNMVERPLISLNSNEVLRPGMVLCLEPSALSEYGWYNFEQMILINENGYELLSKAPIDFFQI